MLRLLLASVAVAVAVGVVHLGTGPAEYVYDDVRFVAMNPAVQEGAPFLGYFTDPATQTSDASFAGLYRPLRTLSFRLGRLAGEGAPAQRAIGVLLHLLNGVLVFLLLRRLPAGPGGAILPPILGALLFVAHPLAVEPAAWISARGDLLALTGMLGAVLLHLRRGRAATAAAAACFLLALLGKESAIVLPLLLVATDGFAGGLRRVRERLPAYLPHVAVLVGYAGLRLAVLGAEDFAQGRGLGLHGLTLLSSILAGGVYYLVTFLFPVRLSFELRIAPGPEAPLLAVLGFLAAAAAVAIAVRCRRRAPAVTTAILWTLVTLLPVTLLQLLFPLKILVANRFAYPALVGVAALGAWVATRGRAQAVLVALVVVCFLPFSRGRAEAWRNPESLWGDVLERDADNPVALYGLGFAALDKEDWAEARLRLGRALAKDPLEPKLAFFCGEASDRLAIAAPVGSEERRKLFDEAFQSFHLATRIWQSGNSRGVVLYRSALVHAGWLALEVGRKDLARQHVVDFLGTAGRPWVRRRPGVLASRLRDLAEFARSEERGDLAEKLLEAAAGLGRRGER